MEYTTTEGQGRLSQTFLAQPVQIPRVRVLAVDNNFYLKLTSYSSSSCVTSLVPGLSLTKWHLSSDDAMLIAYNHATAFSGNIFSLICALRALSAPNVRPPPFH